MKISIIFLSMYILFSLTGCEPAGQKDFEGQSAPNAEEISQEVAKKAEKTAKELKKVDEAIGVSKDKDVYVHLYVTGFDRLFLESIRTEAKEKLEAANPDGKVEISTDKKFELELTELKKKLSAQEITKKQLEEDLKKVEEDMKAGE